MVVQTGDNRFATADFIVNSDASKGTNTTIASALTEAGTNGGTVYVSPGQYTENLTIPSGVQIVGASKELTTIIGTHTPPATGDIELWNVGVQGTAAIFSGAVAGAGNIILNNVNINVSNGYAFNLTAWTGNIELRDVSTSSTTDGFINTTASTGLILNDSQIGTGTANSLSTSGVIDAFNCFIDCDIATTGSAVRLFRCNIDQITISSLTIAVINNCNITRTAASPVIFNSSLPGTIYNTTIDTNTSASAIGGTGTGTLSLGGITFTDTNTIAAGLTISARNFYSGSYKSDYTNHGILLGQGNQGNIIATSEMSDGQLLIGRSGNNPVTAGLTAGDNITITPGAGSLTIASTGGTSITWTTVTGTTQQLAGNNGYVVNNTAAVTLTLPTTIAVGEVIYIDTIGTGAFTIAQAAGQQIHFIGASTTAGTTGNVTSVSQYSSIELRCVVANTMFQIQNSSGNFNIT